MFVFLLGFALFGIIQGHKLFGRIKNDYPEIYDIYKDNHFYTLTFTTNELKAKVAAIDNDRSMIQSIERISVLQKRFLCLFVIELLLLISTMLYSFLASRWNAQHNISFKRDRESQRNFWKVSFLSAFWAFPYALGNRFLAP